MSLDPTPEQITAMKTLQDVMDWVEMPGDGATVDVQAALMVHLGATKTMHPRLVGILVEDAF